MIWILSINLFSIYGVSFFRSRTLSFKFFKFSIIEESNFWLIVDSFSYLVISNLLISNLLIFSFSSKEFTYDLNILVSERETRLKNLKGVEVQKLKSNKRSKEDSLYNSTIATLVRKKIYIAELDY